MTRRKIVELAWRGMGGALRAPSRQSSTWIRSPGDAKQTRGARSPHQLPGGGGQRSFLFGRILCTACLSRTHVRTGRRALGYIYARRCGELHNSFPPQAAPDPYSHSHQHTRLAHTSHPVPYPSIASVSMFQVASHPSSFATHGHGHHHSHHSSSHHSSAHGSHGVNLPRTLQRPQFYDIPSRNIAAVAPDLSGVPIEYVRRGLYPRARECVPSDHSSIPRTNPYPG